MTTTLLGTAFRTPAVPSVDSAASVYAVWPPAHFARGHKSTTHLFVISSAAVGDTCVHPCDRDGNLLALELLACVPIRNHRAAVRAAGYELEVVHVHA